MRNTGCHSNSLKMFPLSNTFKCLLLLLFLCVTLTCRAVRPKQLTPLTCAPARRRSSTCAVFPCAAARVSLSSRDVAMSPRAHTHAHTRPAATNVFDRQPGDDAPFFLFIILIWRQQGRLQNTSGPRVKKQSGSASVRGGSFFHRQAPSVTPGPPVVRLGWVSGASPVLRSVGRLVCVWACLAWMGDVIVAAVARSCACADNNWFWQQERCCEMMESDSSRQNVIQSNSSLAQHVSNASFILCIFFFYFLLAWFPVIVWFIVGGDTVIVVHMTKYTNNM